MRIHRRLDILPTLLAACLLGGCGGSAKTTAIVEKPDGSALDLRTGRAAATDDSVNPDTLDLVAQAQRDIEAFNMRRSGTQPAASEWTDPQNLHPWQETQAIAGSSTPTEFDAAQRRIEWNTPDYAYQQSQAAASQPATASTSAAAITASAEPTKTFRQGPMFAPISQLPVTESGDGVESGGGSEPGGGAAQLDQRQIDQLIVDLSGELYRDATYADMPIKQLMVIAAMTMIDPDRAIDPQAIPGLSERERELLAAFQACFTELGQKLDGQRPADEVIGEAMVHLREKLSTTPPLKIARAAFCTAVNGFGNFKEFDRYAFVAHEQQRVIVYLEIESFTSELNENSEWVTELSQELMIYADRDGIPVWREDWQAAVDRTRNKRHDFFTVQIITIPKALSVGRYQLKIRVRDEQSGAETESAITFEMVADPKMAATKP